MSNEGSTIPGTLDRGAPPDAARGGMTVSERIGQLCAERPEALCCSLRVSGRWHDHTRAEFWDQVRRSAALFASLPAGSLVLFIKKPDLHLVAAYLGAMHAGHIPAQMSPPTAKMNAEEYARKMRHVRNLIGPHALFTDDPDAGQAHDRSWGPVLSPADLPADAGEVRPVRNSDALAQFSSGSTGMQKGVVLSHRAVIEQVRTYAEALRIAPTDAVVSWLPLYHDMGLVACYLMPLLCGIPFHLMDAFDWIVQPDLLFAAIEQKRPTICFLPNFAYPVMARKGKKHDLRSMRLWVNCSEPARVQSHAAFLQAFPEVDPVSLTVCYALAENTFAVSQSLAWHGNVSRRDPATGALSCGRPLPGMEVRIVPDEGDRSGTGEIGIRSPCLFTRFIDGSVPLTADGFYLTGDLGFLDDQGDLFVTGRKKDVIIVNGKNVFPQDVEYAASGVPGVYPGRAVAFGHWDETLGSEELIVIAERKPGEPATPLKIAVQKAVQLEVGVVPKRVEVVEHMTLVKTSSGKLSRSRNRELYATKGFMLL